MEIQTRQIAAAESSRDADSGVPGPQSAWWPAVLLLLLLAACGHSSATSHGPAIGSMSDPLAFEHQAIAEIQQALSTDALWPGFDLTQHALILRSLRGRKPRLWCIGMCSFLCESGAFSCQWTTNIPLPNPTRNVRDVGYAILDGATLRTTDEILLIDIGPGADNPRCVAATAIHECFHLYYQKDRDLAVPGERMPPSSQPLARPSSYYELGSRDYLSRSYVEQPRARETLDAEIVTLAAAVRFARAGDQPNSLLAVAKFRALRNERRASMAAAVDEDLWELREGVPALMESRNSRRFPGEHCSVLEYVTEGGSWRVRAGGSYFLVTGGLQALLLDLIQADWPTIVYPGRPGEGRSLFFAVEMLKERQ